MMSTLQAHFIVGIGRSGTTLLMNILNAHQDISAFPEIRFFNFFYNGWKNKKTFTRSDLENIRTYLLSYGPKVKNSPYTWKENEMLEILSKEKAVNFQKIYSEFYRSVVLKGEEKNTRIIFDKNPINTIFLEEIAETFPDAKFIFIVRDPRANYLSRKQKVIRRTPEIYFNSYRWNRYNQYALDFSRKHPHKFIRLKYEDLVLDPESQIKRIAAFFGFQYNANMLNFHKKIKEKTADLVKHDTSGLLEEKFGKLSNPINTSRLESWKKELSQKEIEIINSVCGTLATELGYDIAPGKTRGNLKAKLKTKFDFYYTKLMFRMPLSTKLSRIRKPV